MQTKSGKRLFPIGIGTWNIGGTFNPNDPTAKYKGAEPSYDNEKAEVEAIRYSISSTYNETSAKKSRQLSSEIKKVANETGSLFFDASTVARAGRDGIHFDEQSHSALAQSLFEIVKHETNDEE